MKKLRRALVVTLALSVQGLIYAESKQLDLFPIDKVVAVIYNEDGVSIITQSDIDRPSLDGTFRSLNDLILEDLMFSEGKRFKMLPDEEQIDKQLKAVQRENNMSAEQLNDLFKAAGYTYEEGREQFARMTTINALLDFKIRSRLIVPEREVVAYYKEHPEVEPEAYYLTRTVIPFSNSIQDQQESLEKSCACGKEDSTFSWSTPFWINRQDLAEDKVAIIETLKPGCISQPVHIATGFELFKLLEKKEERVTPLEQQYSMIANILRKPRYEALMKEYKKSLLDNASIVYF